MTRRTALVAATLLLAPLAAAVPQVGATATSVQQPRWLTHVQRYEGGISSGVRASVAAAAMAPGARSLAAPGGRASAAAAVGANTQMNDDSNPPLPQNETSVAVNVFNPKIAVAGANDYVSGGVAVMRTLNGGATWTTTRVIPVFAPTSDACSGGDPAIAYSRRDRAFYLAQLCFFRSLPFSEVQVFKSVDNGLTWTPGRRSAVPATNFNSRTGEANEAVFHDKEWITVDNTPTSPFYGRVYVTWTKFHVLPDASSDYCPIQLAYTDVIPTFNPSLTTWKHAHVAPNAPGDDGVGESANQFSVPQVDRQGVLDISYNLEDCNSSTDRGFRYQKSADGGQTFLTHPVRINKVGQFRDNPHADDSLPPTAFRAPNTTAHAVSPRTGTIAFVYQNNINRPASKADISLQVSRDGGLHWSDTRTLSVGSGGDPARNDQFFPWVTVDEAGVFYAVWFDRRTDDANRRIDTWYAVSRDDGRTWASRRISTVPWNPDLGFFKSGAFIGDYNGIAAWGGLIYPVWTDGRNNAINRTGIGETDVFTAVQRR